MLVKSAIAGMASLHGVMAGVASLYRMGNTWGVMAETSPTKKPSAVQANKAGLNCCRKVISFSQVFRRVRLRNQ